MSLAERVKVMQAERLRWGVAPGNDTIMEAALCASDALLLSDAAVERVARALALHDGVREAAWAPGFMPTVNVESYRISARVALGAALEMEG